MCAKNSCSNSWTRLLTNSLDQTRFTCAEMVCQHSHTHTLLIWNSTSKQQMGFITSLTTLSVLQTNLQQAKVKWASTVVSVSYPQKRRRGIVCTVFSGTNSNPRQLLDSLGPKSLSINPSWIGPPPPPAALQRGTRDLARWQTGGQHSCVSFIGGFSL